MNDIRSALEAALSSNSSAQILHEVIAPDGTHGTVATKDLQRMPADYEVTGRFRIYGPTGEYEHVYLAQFAEFFAAGYRFTPGAPEGEAGKSGRIEDADLLAENHELRLQLDALRELFRAGRYAITNEATLQGVLQDAFRLYDVITDRRDVGALLDVLWNEKAKRYGIENAEAMLPAMAEYLVPRVLEFLKVRRCDPLYGELTGLVDRLRAELAANAKLVSDFREHFQALARDAGITEPDEIALYLNALSLDCRGRSEVERRLERGDWTGVDAVFRALLERSGKLIS